MLYVVKAKNSACWELVESFVSLCVRERREEKSKFTDPMLLLIIAWTNPIALKGEFVNPTKRMITDLLKLLTDRYVTKL